MVNRLILQGRFTQTPELRSTLGGINVVRFTLASQRDKAGQNGEREADFIQCVAWRGTAEFVCRNFTKGQSAVIEGAVRSKKWVEDDKTRYGTEVEVSEIHFCGGKKDNPSVSCADTPLCTGEACEVPAESQGTFNGGWPPPGENAFSLGDVDDLPY